MRRRGVGGVVALGGVGFGVRVRGGREAAREEDEREVVRDADCAPALEHGCEEGEGAVEVELAGGCVGLPELLRDLEEEEDGGGLRAEGHARARAEAAAADHVRVPRHACQRWRRWMRRPKRGAGRRNAQAAADLIPRRARQRGQRPCAGRRSGWTRAAAASSTWQRRRARHIIATPPGGSHNAAATHQMSPRERYWSRNTISTHSSSAAAAGTTMTSTLCREERPKSDAVAARSETPWEPLPGAAEPTRKTRAPRSSAPPVAAAVAGPVGDDDDGDALPEGEPAGGEMPASLTARTSTYAPRDMRMSSSRSCESSSSSSDCSAVWSASSASFAAEAVDMSHVVTVEGRGATRGLQ